MKDFLAPVRPVQTESCHLQQDIGRFQATAEDWTIGRCSMIEDGRMKVRYPGQPERKFHPELLSLDQVQVIGTVRSALKAE